MCSPDTSLLISAEVLAVLLNDGSCPKTGSKLLRKDAVHEMLSNQIPRFLNYSRQGISAAKPDLTNPITELYLVFGDHHPYVCCCTISSTHGLLWFRKTGEPTCKSTLSEIETQPIS